MNRHNKKYKLKIGIIGCGFVADYYLRHLKQEKRIHIIGATDLIHERVASFSTLYQIPIFDSLQQLLHAGIDILINLSNPGSHYAINKAALKQGVHVYCEKPLCLNFDRAKELVQLAKQQDLHLISAPCSLLSETAQALLKAVQSKAIGTIRLAYAEMDDGPVHLMQPEKWATARGIPWPYEEEFKIGCTLEHAGYSLSWLAALLGPIKQITAFSSCLSPHKMPDLLDPIRTPDFSVACLQHTSGAISRLSCGIMAPMDRSLRLIGDQGVLRVADIWDNFGTIEQSQYSSLKLKAERKDYIKNSWLGRLLFGLTPKKIKQKRKGGKRFGFFPEDMRMNYCLGISDLVSAILEKRAPLLSTDFCLHINEATLKIHQAIYENQLIEMETDFTCSQLAVFGTA